MRIYVRLATFLFEAGASRTPYALRTGRILQASNPNPAAYEKMMFSRYSGAPFADIFEYITRGHKTFAGYEHGLRVGANYLSLIHI